MNLNPFASLLHRPVHQHLCACPSDHVDARRGLVGGSPCTGHSQVVYGDQHGADHCMREPGQIGTCQDRALCFGRPHASGGHGVAHAPTGLQRATRHHRPGTHSSMPCTSSCICPVQDHAPCTTHALYSTLDRIVSSLCLFCPHASNSMLRQGQRQHAWHRAVHMPACVGAGSAHSMTRTMCTAQPHSHGPVQSHIFNYLHTDTITSSSSNSTILRSIKYSASYKRRGILMFVLLSEHFLVYHMP
jgi:hypothetical protein